MIKELQEVQGGPPTSYKWSCNPYKWPHKWVTGIIMPISGVMGPYLQLVGADLVVRERNLLQNARNKPSTFY